MRYFDDEGIPRPPAGDADSQECQNWACGPFGFWPLLGCPPVGVSWGYTVACVAAAARL